MESSDYTSSAHFCPFDTQCPNCKHIANAITRKKIEQICRENGYEPSVICTPEELIEE